jgi:hypothetical protein
LLSLGEEIDNHAGLPHLSADSPIVGNRGSDHHGTSEQGIASANDEGREIFPFFAASVSATRSGPVGTSRQTRFTGSFRESGGTLACAHKRNEGLGYGNEELAFPWLAKLGHLAHLPPWSLANAKNLASGEFPFAGGLILLLVASMLWQTFPMAVTAAGLVLILQEIADPSPLFLAVPWEALEFVLSRKVRVNDFWLHRTQGKKRDAPRGSSQRCWTPNLEGPIQSSGASSEFRSKKMKARGSIT